MRQFEPDRSTDSSRDTDDSQDTSAHTRSVADSVSSDGSDRSFRQLPPPPTVSVKPAAQLQHHPQYSHSQQQPPSSSSQHKPPMRPNMDLLQPTSLSLPVAPVTLYESEARGPMSRSVDGYPRHVPRYASSPASSSAASSSYRGGGSSYDQPQSFVSEYSYSDSTRSNSSSRHEHESHALTTTTGMASGQVLYDASPRAVPPSNNYTPDAMMAQMIKMNIMAEKAQAMVEQNDRIARGYSPQY